MRVQQTLLTLAVAGVASAHYGLDYPSWRADTLSSKNEDKYSQWTYPCAGVDYGEGNVTDWPLDGGAVKLALHHDWTYVFINLGLGENTTNFNVSLTPEFWNATGKGDLCVEKLPLPNSVKVKEGDLASIQVVTVGDSGSALYNCADIRFSKNAKGPSNCTSDVKYVAVKEQSGDGSKASNATGSNNSTGSSSGNKDSGAGILGFNAAALTSTVVLTAVFVAGLGL